MDKIKIGGFVVIVAGLLFLVLDAATIRFCQTAMCRTTQHIAVGVITLLALLVGVGMINYHKMKHMVKTK